MAAASVPALTTVRMPVAEIVAAGVELCFGDAVWSEEGLAPRKVFQPSLIVRGLDRARDRRVVRAAPRYDF
jgi:DNA-binding LacI/PurR family transcriptional regulator